MSRGAPPQRGVPTSRGGLGGPSRGRGLPSMSAPPPRPQALVQEYEDYSTPTYEPEPAYAQESSYEDTYSAPRARDPYAEEYAEPAAAGGGDTQYFDYGHGAGAQSYDEYAEPPRSMGYDSRSTMKAPPPLSASRGSRGTYRHDPYGAGRPSAPQPRY